MYSGVIDRWCIRIVNNKDTLIIPYFDKVSIFILQHFVYKLLVENLLHQIRTNVH